MFESRIELFNGYVRCNEFLLYVDIALILHFIYNWYQSYRTTGLKISFWDIFMFKTFFIPLLLLYPFNSSYKNWISFGEHIYSADHYMDEAFSVTVLGYISIWVGKYLYNSLSINILNTRSILNFEKYIQKNIKSRLSVIILIIFSLALLSFMLSHTLGTNYLFNPRSYFLGNKDLRPIYNLLLAIYPISVIFTGLKYIEFRNQITFIFFVILLTLSIFLGTRIAIIEPLMFLILFYYMKNHEKISFRLLFAAFGGILFLFGLLSVMRSGNNNTEAFIEFLYGNHFSDTRDFAYLIAYFNDNWVFGKTYIAGLITFIPRQFSDYRENWSFGVYFTRMLGIYDPLFPGYRPGYFGESYFNFGIYGVAALGIWTGIVLQHIQTKILKEFHAANDVIKMYSYTFPLYLILILNCSLNFVTFYSFVIIMLVLSFVRHAIEFSKSKQDAKLL